MNAFAKIPGFSRYPLLGIILMTAILVALPFVASAAGQAWVRILNFAILYIFLALGLVIFCAFVFVGGLKLPIPLCPDIESLQSAIKVCRA